MMGLGTAYTGVPAKFAPAMILYHLLPLHFPVTLFGLDAPFGRFNNGSSKFHVNGNIGWFFMEIVAPVTLLYTLLTSEVKLNPNSTILATLYIVHYVHRAILSPLVLSPKRTDTNVVVPVLAGSYNLLNAYCLALGLIYYPAQTGARTIWCLLGWAAGFVGNIYHDEILNDIRRPEGKKLVSAPDPREVEKDKKAGNGRYAIPRGGLFNLVSFPNYLCEWFEWTCFAIAAAPGVFIDLPLTSTGSLPSIVQRTLDFLPWKPTTLLHPAWIFVIFLISSMAPRALRSHWWYHHTFGDRYPKSRKAVLPGLL